MSRDYSRRSYHHRKRSPSPYSWQESQYESTQTSWRFTPQLASYSATTAAVPSSPTRLPDDDEAVTMRLYCEWHASKKPRLAQRFMEAFEALKDSCLTLHHIQKWETNYGWTRFNIPEGIGLTLAEEAKTYMKERQHGTLSRR